MSHPVVRIEDRYDRHRAELVAFLRRRVPASEAEEIAQDVWLKVTRVAPECPDDLAFRGYLFTVARRLLVDHYRRRSSQVRLVPIDGGNSDIAGPSAEGDPEGVAGAAEMLSVVEGALAGLDPGMADVFRWRMTEDVSFQEIAARQGTPLNTALGRMHRATKRIAEALAARGLLPRAPEER